MAARIRCRVLTSPHQESKSARPSAQREQSPTAVAGLGEPIAAVAQHGIQPIGQCRNELPGLSSPSACSQGSIVGSILLTKRHVSSHRIAEQQLTRGTPVNLLAYIARRNASSARHPAG